jgi:hypothetical protein
VFEFISNFGGAAADTDTLQLKFQQLIDAEQERPGGAEAEDDLNDAVFAQSFIPRSLAEVRLCIRPTTSWIEGIMLASGCECGAGRCRRC